MSTEEEFPYNNNTTTANSSNSIPLPSQLDMKVTRFSHLDEDQAARLYEERFRQIESDIMKVLQTSKKSHRLFPQQQQSSSSSQQFQNQWQQQQNKHNQIARSNSSSHNNNNNYASQNNLRSSQILFQSTTLTSSTSKSPSYSLMTKKNKAGSFLHSSAVTSVSRLVTDENDSENNSNVQLMSSTQSGRATAAITATTTTQQQLQQNPSFRTTHSNIIPRKNQESTPTLPKQQERNLPTKQSKEPLNQELKILLSPNKSNKSTTTTSSTYSKPIRLAASMTGFDQFLSLGGKATMNRTEDTDSSQNNNNNVQQRVAILRNTSPSGFIRKSQRHHTTGEIIDLSSSIATTTNREQKTNLNIAFQSPSSYMNIRSSFEKEYSTPQPVSFRANSKLQKVDLDTSQTEEPQPNRINNINNQNGIFNRTNKKSLSSSQQLSQTYKNSSEWDEDPTNIQTYTPRSSFKDFRPQKNLLRKHVNFETDQKIDSFDETKFKNVFLSPFNKAKQLHTSSSARNYNNNNNNNNNNVASQNNQQQQQQQQQYFQPPYRHGVSNSYTDFSSISKRSDQTGSPQLSSPSQTLQTLTSQQLSEFRSSSATPNQKQSLLPSSDQVDQHDSCSDFESNEKAVNQQVTATIIAPAAIQNTNWALPPHAPSSQYSTQSNSLHSRVPSSMKQLSSIRTTPVKPQQTTAVFSPADRATSLDSSPLLKASTFLSLKPVVCQSSDAIPPMKSQQGSQLRLSEQNSIPKPLNQITSPLKLSDHPKHTLKAYQNNSTATIKQQQQPQQQYMHELNSFIKHPSQQFSAATNSKGTTGNTLIINLSQMQKGDIRSKSNSRSQLTKNTVQSTQQQLPTHSSQVRNALEIQSKMKKQAPTSYVQTNPKVIKKEALLEDIELKAMSEDIHSKLNHLLQRANQQSLSLKKNF